MLTADYGGPFAGGPDSLSIGAAEPQEVSESDPDASCAFGTPIDKLSGLPTSVPITSRRLCFSITMVLC